VALLYENVSQGCRRAYRGRMPGLAPTSRCEKAARAIVRAWPRRRRCRAGGTVKAANSTEPSRTSDLVILPLTLPTSSALGDAATLSWSRRKVSSLFPGLFVTRSGSRMTTRSRTASRGAGQSWPGHWTSPSLLAPPLFRQANAAQPGKR
jgi:hypothetical protein